MNEPSNNRRKILQGSLAAPLVLTVSSASAQAVNSFTQCIENTRDNQPASSKIFLASVPPEDNWFRCTVTVYTFSKDGITVKLYKDGTTYKKVADGTSVIITGWTQTGQATWHRLVYFGTDGTPKGAGWEGKSAGGYAVTVSCGGSFGVRCA